MSSDVKSVADGIQTPTPVTWVGPARNSSRRRTFAMIIVLFASSLPPLDPILNSVLLPLAAEELDMNTTQFALAAGLESMVVVAAILAAGNIGDRIGRRRLTILALVLFAAGELITSFAPSPGIFLAGRAVTGLGAGAIFSMTLALLTAMYFPNERPRIFGYLGGVIAFMSALTLILGGEITTATDNWRDGYLMRPAIAIIILIIFALLVPESRAKIRGRFDLFGVITAGLGLVLLLYALSIASQRGWTSLQVLIPLVLAALTLIAFVHHERRLENPSFPIWLYRRQDFVSANFLVFALNFGVGALTVLLAQLLQEAMGWSAAKFGMLSLTIVLGEIIGALVAGRYLRKTGKFQVTSTAATALVVIGCVLLALLSDPISELQLALGLFIIGFGLMSGVVTTNTILMDDAPEDKLGSVAAVPTIMSEVALGVGLALLLPLMASVAGGTLSSGTVPASNQLSGFTVAMWVTSGIILVLGGIAIQLLRIAKRKGLAPGKS